MHFILFISCPCQRIIRNCQEDIDLKKIFLFCIGVYSVKGFLGVSNSKGSACNAGDPVSSLGREDPLEKGMATYSSILAWRILWTEESGVLQSHSPTVYSLVGS